MVIWFLSVALLASMLSIFVPAAQATSMTWTNPGAEKIGWRYSEDSYVEDSDIDFHPTSIAFGNGIFVAVSDSYQNNTAIETSADGNTWIPRVADTTVQWNTIAFGGGVFIALGINQNWDASVGMKSTDGINWTPITLASTDVNWKSLTYGGGRFVAVGEPNAGSPSSLTMYSSNGITWSMGAGDNGQYWNAVTYGDGKFVAVGRNGSGLQDEDVITSSDGGQNWTTSGSDHEIEWAGITFGNHTFLAVSQGTIMTSTDGSTWVETNNNTANYVYDAWYRVIYAANKFILIGDDGQNSGRIAVSSDAVNWEYQQVQLARSWSAAAFGNNRLVITNRGSGAKLISNLQYSIPTYDLRVSALDNRTGLPRTTFCDQCGFRIRVDLVRTDGAILDLNSASSITATVTGGSVTISGGNTQALDSGGGANFDVTGNGTGVGNDVLFHFQSTTISAAQDDLTLRIIAADLPPTISTTPGQGGVLLTITPAVNAQPDTWEIAISRDQSNSDQTVCEIDVSTPISFLPLGRESYTVQSYSYNGVTFYYQYPTEYYYDSTSDAWYLSISREAVDIPNRIFLPGLQDGCSYDLSVIDQKEGFSTSPVQTTFLYSTPTVLAPNFVLTSTSETVTAGSAITGYQVISTGGAISSFSITPTPNNGTLTFNTATGLLLGVPSANQSSLSYFITGHNQTSPDLTRRFTLTVSGGSQSQNGSNNSSGVSALQARINREALIAASRARVIKNIQEKKVITVSDLAASELPVSSERILARANIELQSLQAKNPTGAISIESVTAVLRQETVVEQLSNPVGQAPLRTFDLVSTGLMEGKNPNKTLIFIWLKKLPTSNVDSFEKIKNAISTLERDIQARKEKLAKLRKLAS